MPKIFLNRFIDKMYTIVIFTKTNDVEGVPSNWITKQDSTKILCRWPLVKNQVEMEKLILNREEPNITWKSYPVKIVCTSTSYETMVEKRNFTQMVSDISDSEETSRNKKRKRRPSFESDEEFVTDDNLSPVSSPPSELDTFFYCCMM